MRNRTVRVRLWGAGGVLAASAVAAAILFAAPGTGSPAQDQAVPAAAAGDAGLRRGGREARHRALGRVLRPPRGHRARGRPRAGGRSGSGRPFPRGRARQGRRPPDHDRSGALRGAGQACRGAGGGGGGAAGARLERARQDPPAVGAARRPATRARRADKRAAGGRGQPARRGGRAGGGQPRARIYLGARAGVRAGRQARGHGRQPRGGRPGGAGADDAGVGRPDLCELQRRRGDGGAGARARSAPTRTRSSAASRCGWTRRPATARPTRARCS